MDAGLEPGRLQLLPELLDPFSKAVLDADRQIAHPKIEQFLVRKTRPVGRHGLSGHPIDLSQPFGGTSGNAKLAGSRGDDCAGRTPPAP